MNDEVQHAVDNMTADIIHTLAWCEREHGLEARQEAEKAICAAATGAKE